MNFKCKTKELLQAILRIETATSKSIPILDNICLELVGNVLNVFATNTELSLKTNIDCEGVIDGKILIPSKKIIDILKELKTDDISFVLKEKKTEKEIKNELKIKSGKSNFTLNIIENIDDYLIVENFNTNNAFLSINLNKLQKCLDLTVFCVSDDMTRFVLTGVLLEINDSKMKLVSTDGRRLSYVESNSVNGDIDLRVVLSKKLIIEILKLKNEKENENICFYITDSKIFIKFKNIEMVSSLIEGQFPDYNKIIPTNLAYSIKIKTNELLETTKRVSVLNPKDKNYPTIYDFNNNKIVIKSNIPGIGEALEEIDIEYNNNQLITAYNSMYLIDCLKKIESESLIFNISNGVNPAYIEIVSDINFKYVLMPMRI